MLNCAGSYKLCKKVRTKAGCADIYIKKKPSIQEKIGRIIIENRLYQGVASIIANEWKIKIIMKGIQQMKSVVMIRNIFLFIRRLLFKIFLLVFDFMSLLDDLLDMRQMEIYESEMKRKQAKFMARMLQTKFL